MAREKVKSSRVSLLLRIALLLLAAALALWMVIWLVIWQVDIHEKQTRLQELNAQIAAQQTRNEEVQKSVDALESDEGVRDYVERKAREDLDYGKPGERVFVDVGGGG